MRQLFQILMLLLGSLYAAAQNDTADVEAVRRMVNLSEVVVRSDLNVARFLQRIKDDTTFYKAFRNLRVLSFTSLNDIRMLDKKGAVIASLQSKTRQLRADSCRTMEVQDETTTGDMKNGDSYNYYTAQLYAGLFFTNGKVCGETNIVTGAMRNVRDKKGFEKNKEQLKMLFFNPGKKIPGIPFIGDKLDIFDERLAQYYNFNIDFTNQNGQDCYLFSIRRRDDLTASERSAIVFDNITTWFNAKTMEIVARNYDLSYNTLVYDFDVHMEVEMTHFGALLVPQVLRYKGNWEVAFKKRERGVFTATLSDFGY
jgi:hypothetical protein